MANVPEDLHYSKDHEWVRVDGNVAIVGITDYAQDSLGDVVYVELPAIGAKLKAGQSFGTIESVKAVSEIYAPVSGEVVEVNSGITGKPEVVNKDPHATWLIVLKLTNPDETGGLLDAAQYAALVK